MIIESHSHISLPLAGIDLAREVGYGKPIEGIDEYLASYRENKVDACWVFGGWAWRNDELVVPENDALATLLKTHAAKLFPWGSVNPFWEEKRLRSEIQRVKTLGLFGIKLVPVIRGCSLSSGQMDIVADELQNCDLPVFFHDGSPEYCSAVQIMHFARRHQDIRVVSGHSGLREYWRDFVDHAQDIENLWFCLSGPTQWGIQRFYDVIGPERIMFGSDGGLGTPAVIKAYLRRIAALRAPEEHKAMILGENAARFFNSPQ